MQSLEEKIKSKIFTNKNQTNTNINKEKKDLILCTKEIKEFNNYLDIIILILKNKFVMISEFLDEIIRAIRIMDDWLISIDRGDSFLLYSNK